LNGTEAARADSAGRPGRLLGGRGHGYSAAKPASPWGCMDDPTRSAWRFLLLCGLSATW